MVVVDSSALIPLARSGNLSLVGESYENIFAVEEVKDETVAPGKRGSSELDEAFSDWIEVEEVESSSDLAEMEGIEETDARAIMLAEKLDEELLANDKALVKVARTRGIETVWPTTLILRSVDRGRKSSEEAEQVLYDLVNNGMNLSTQVYSQIQKEIRQRGE